MNKLNSFLIEMIPISDSFYAQEHIYVGKITPKFPKDAILAYVKNCKVCN